MGMEDDATARAAIYSAREDVILRDIAGEHLLVPIRHDVADMQAIYAMTGIGARIWGLLDGRRTLGQVHAAVAEGFEVDEDQAWKDLCEFVGSLEERRLVERRA